MANGKITEEVVVKKVKEYVRNNMLNETWDEDKETTHEGHIHGVDIEFIGGTYNGQHFSIECKGESKTSNERSKRAIDSECWLNALGQIITRMGVRERKNKTKDHKINGAYRYGLGLYWKTAQVALRRIPKNVAEVLHLHIFSVYDDETVKHFEPHEFGEENYPDELFANKKD